MRELTAGIAHRLRICEGQSKAGHITATAIFNLPIFAFAVLEGLVDFAIAIIVGSIAEFARKYAFAPTGDSAISEALAGIARLSRVLRLIGGSARLR